MFLYVRSLGWHAPLTFCAAFATTLVLSLEAAAQAAPAAGPAPSPLLQFVPFAVMIGIMYFLMIRPQQKKAQTHKEFLNKLKRGDEVVTASGLLGRIEGMTDLFITLEVAPNVRIKILRSQIATFVPTAPATTTEVKA